MSKRTPRRTTSRAKQLENRIVELEKIAEFAQDATGAPNASAAVAATAKAAALEEDLGRLLKAATIARIKDPLKRVGALRRQAQEAGSWQAAARFAAQEAEMEVRLRELEVERVRLEMHEVPPEELFAMLIETVNALPEQELEELARHLWRKLGAKAAQLAQG